MTEPTLGDRYIALGEALNNGKSPIEDVVRLAYDAGLLMCFRVNPDEAVDLEVNLERRHD